MKRLTTNVRIMCDNNAATCNNIALSHPNGITDVVLYSLSYNRIIKWGDTMNERITYQNTFIKTQIDKINGAASGAKEALRSKLTDMLVKHRIYQIKFSSWTRGQEIIDHIMAAFPRSVKKGFISGFPITATQDG